ncbi:MAG: hypothetical protein U0519_03420 [Candidatus Gracilibacteria bacterium]
MGTQETASEQRKRLSITEYVNRMGMVDTAYDPVSPRHAQRIDDEFEGVLEGEDWDEETHRYIHDLVSVIPGIKVYTRAMMSEENLQAGKTLNDPSAVDYYEVWASDHEVTEKLIINTRDPARAREIHRVLSEMIIQKSAPREAIDWLMYESPYASMTSAENPENRLIDVITATVRRRIAAYSPEK